MRANPDYSSGTQRGPDMAARWDALQLRLSELGGLARPDARTLALFARQLALVLSAGLHLCPALEALSAQARSALMRAVLREAVLSINCGNTLWSVMERHPGVFPPYFRALTRTGEESGSLGAALRKLARDCERELELSSRIHPVLNYSALLLCIAVLPLVAGHFWDRNGNKALLSFVVGAPVAIWIAYLEPMVLAHTAHEIDHRPPALRIFDGGHDLFRLVEEDVAMRLGAGDQLAVDLDVIARARHWRLYRPAGPLTTR